jgi:hypothetical protein
VHQDIDRHASARAQVDGQNAGPDLSRTAVPQPWQWFTLTDLTLSAFPFVPDNIRSEYTENDENSKQGYRRAQSLAIHMFLIRQ